MWTRYYDAATEAEKEEHLKTWKKGCVSVSGKPPGLYMAQDNDWIKWYNEHGKNLHFRYTHKKQLVNRDAFRILTLDMTNFQHYLTTIPYFTHYKEVDWHTIFDEGYDGVHITAPLLDNALSIFLKHKVQFGGFDVETLVIWASPSKQKMEWTQLVALIE